MTVRIEKPAINVREELADLRKPTGIAGEAMLRAETPQEQFNLIGAGRRNLIINGDMRIAQRGTSFTNPNAVYTLDRFMARAGTSGALTVSQQSMDYGQTDVPNIQNYARLAQTTARTGAFSAFWQRVEDVTIFDNTTVTVSFYAKCSVNKEIKLTTYQDFGASGSSDTVVNTTVFNISTSWKRYEVTMHCPSISGKTVNAGSHLLLEFRDETLGAFTLDITGVQLELGKVATPFEHRSYGEELALCQRFYTRMGNDDGGFTHLMVGSAEGASIYVLSRTLPTGMRAVPSVTLGSGVRAFTASAGVGTVNSFNTRCTRDIACISANISTTATTGQAAVLYDSGANGYIEYDSEL